MILYRSIGESELNQLLNNHIVHGRYNCATEYRNTTKITNACCFFIDEVRWKDSLHKFMVVVDIPNEELEFGTGTYYASKSLKNTKVWTGRNGSEHYEIREAYAYSYSISQVKELYLFGRFASHYVTDRIKPICEKYGIVCHHTDNIPFVNSEQKFVKDGIKYKTNDALKDWLTPFKIDEDNYIEDLKEMFAKTKITLEQARKIRAILLNGKTKEELTYVRS